MDKIQPLKMRIILIFIGRICSLFIPRSLFYSWIAVKKCIFTGYMKNKFKHIGKNTLLSTNSTYRDTDCIWIGDDCSIGDYSILTAWKNYSHTNQQFTKGAHTQRTTTDCNSSRYKVWRTEHRDSS